MNKSELVNRVQNGNKVIIQLTDAEVVSIKKDHFKTYRSGWAAGSYKKFVVKDPVYGTIWFCSSGDFFWNLDVDDKISLKVTVSGVGTPSERYPDPILFAKPLRKSKDNPVSVVKGYSSPNVEDSVDLGINV